MAVIVVQTFIECFCTDCGMWSRTHYDYMTCAACGHQTAKSAEFIESAIEPDVLTTDDEPF